jgi:hypothetical protein
MKVAIDCPIIQMFGDTFIFVHQTPWNSWAFRFDENEVVPIDAFPEDDDEQETGEVFVRRQEACSSCTGAQISNFEFIMFTTYHYNTHPLIRVDVLDTFRGIWKHVGDIPDEVMVDKLYLC